MSLRGLLTFILYLGVLATAMAMIYTKHESRVLFGQLQQYQQEIDSLQIEWSQLLLEQGTWGSNVRVEKIARDHLQMIVPKPKDVVNINKSG